MLTLFTIKKILFFGSLGVGVLGPIIGTSPIIKEFTWGNSDISPLKEGIFDLANVNIYEDVSIPIFLEQALIFKEGQEGLIESFAQELTKRWFFSQPEDWISEQRAHWKGQQEQQFKDAWKHLNPKNHQRDFWDNYWGSKESMESFWLRHNSHKLVKSFLTDIKKSDFSFNESWEWHKNNSHDNQLDKLFEKRTFVSDEQLEKPENWSKIGFFPYKSRKNMNDEARKKFIQGKFDFINWSYKRWFEKTLPMYFWKASWYYDENATNSDLEKEYKKSYLKDNFPLRANYAFPIFSSETIAKYKSFIEAFPQNSDGSDSSAAKLELERYHFDNWQGDQPSPSTLLELLNSFNNETPEYASVATYLVNKVLKKGSEGSGVGSKINELQGNKIREDEKKNKPISIFFDEGGGSKHLSFDSDILTAEQSKKYKHIYDVRETNEGWIFFRDARGIHALMLDGYRYLTKQQGDNSRGEECKNQLFNWFNFRNLQSSEIRRGMTSSKKFLNLFSTDNWFSKFSDYLDNNFDKLLTEYFISVGNERLLFNSLNEENKKYFLEYKEVLTKIFELWRANEWNTKIFDLRKKILERYSSRDWKQDNYRNNNIKVVTEQGLSSPFPFSADFSDGKKERFPEQENVFKEFLKPETTTSKAVLTQASAPETTTIKDTETSKKFIEYLQVVKELLKNEKINLKIRSNGFNFQSSQRLFIFDSIFDYLLDKLFANKDLVNYQVKEWKLLKSSFLSKNELLKQKHNSDKNETNLPWLAPLHLENELSELLKPSTPLQQVNAGGSGDGECWECSAFNFGANNEKNKNNLHSLLNKLLKIYFFKNHLKTVKEDYFNFLADFPTGKKTSESSSSKFDFLTDDLFEKWRNNYLSNIKERENFLDFLITLHYLSNKGFEGLRKAMKIELASTTNYHYLLFESTSNQQENNKEIHPLLSNKKEATGDKSFFDSRDGARKYIREKWKTIGKLNLKTSSVSTDDTNTKQAIYKQLMAESVSLPLKESKNNLFNFKNLQKLIVYIESISSPSEFDKLVTLISKVHEKVIPDFYKGEKLFTKERRERKIYLEDKKKILIYQLLNTNEGPFYPAQEISKESEILSKDIKEIKKNAKFPESVTLTAQPAAETGANNHLKGEFFQREMGITKDGDYFIQVSSQDFEDANSTCEFFKLLPIELLAEFLSLEADKSLNKDTAQKSFFENTLKLTARDMKFKSHLDSKHVE